MKIAFLVNDVATEVSEYTTTRLAMAAAKREHEVWYAGLADVELHVYPGARHEVFNETNRDEVERDLLHWLDRVVPSA